MCSWQIVPSGTSLGWFHKTAALPLSNGTTVEYDACSLLPCAAVLLGPEQPPGGPDTPAPGSAIWAKGATRPGGAAAAAPAGSPDEDAEPMKDVDSSKGGPDLSKILPSHEHGIAGEHVNQSQKLLQQDLPLCLWVLKRDGQGCCNMQEVAGCFKSMDAWQQTQPAVVCSTLFCILSLHRCGGRCLCVPCRAYSQA